MSLYFSRKLFLIALLISGIFYVWTLKLSLFNSENHTISYHGHKLFLEDLGSNNFSENYVITFKGPVSMTELEKKVYRPFNYSIAWPTYPVPTLIRNNEPKCSQVFEEWLKIAKQPQLEELPREIPSNQSDDFLLNGYVGLNSWWLDDRVSLKESEKPLIWNYISEWMRFSNKKLLQHVTYGANSFSVLEAMKAHSIHGQSGVVIGSRTPWLEVIAMRNGAVKLLTVEYSKIEIEDLYREKMTAISPLKFAENWEFFTKNGFDFAASFSSIEHSGLGRYGDSFDPIGDIREVQKIRCILKPGGLLFLGFPLGTDAISFNVHRIYGPIRLAMMMVGFEWIGTYNGDGALEMNTWQFHREPLFTVSSQYTLVLRKA